ncbi:Uma2 family endonuclease [Leptolyngbya sp. PCC 6406]|uniref:Uma2 family endonuclease n=1 Tax=Leptolyngbya sp. PCC 6406 TaxID=1173264 RepID=UPI0002AC6422|nr:Uma2 family endonuclease [Leptolyngbya sp. PCC 6406]
MTNPAIAIASPQSFTHSGLTWDQFKALQRAFADSPGVRVAFYRGEVELLSVSPEHGIIAGNLGFLLELWMLEQAIDFIATEDMTVEQEGIVSAQGDKSYCFGTERKEQPDLSIEVVIKGEGQTKLKRYAALGIAEVWFWQNQQITLYQLGERNYRQIETSQFVPGVNLAALAACVAIESRAQALRAFRAQGTE